MIVVTMKRGGSRWLLRTNFPMCCKSSEDSETFPAPSSNNHYSVM
jgi:hypothetical protein